MSSAHGIAQSRYLKKRLKKARSHCKRIKRIKFNLVDYGILDFCRWNANFRWPTMAHINILTTQPQRKWQENLSNCERFSVCPPVISSEAGYGESLIDFMESHMFMCFFHELYKVGMFMYFPYISIYFPYLYIFVHWRVVCFQHGSTLVFNTPIAANRTFQLEVGSPLFHSP